MSNKIDVSSYYFRVNKGITHLVGRKERITTFLTL